MFRAITPGSTVIEGRLIGIDPGPEECFINFHDGTTVRINGQHRPTEFNKIMVAVKAFRDISKLANAELNFIRGSVNLNGAAAGVGVPSVVTQPKNPTTETVVATAPAAAIPPIGNRKVRKAV